MPQGQGLPPSFRPIEDDQNTGLPPSFKPVGEPRIESDTNYDIDTQVLKAQSDARRAKLQQQEEQKPPYHVPDWLDKANEFLNQPSMRRFLYGEGISSDQEQHPIQGPGITPFPGAATAAEYVRNKGVNTGNYWGGFLGDVGSQLINMLGVADPRATAIGGLKPQSTIRRGWPSSHDITPPRKLLPGEVDVRPPFTEGEFTEVPPKVPPQLPPASGPEPIQLPSFKQRFHEPGREGFYPTHKVKKPQVPSAPIREPFSIRNQQQEDPFAFTPPGGVQQQESYYSPEPSFMRPEDVVAETPIQPQREVRPAAELGYENIMRKQNELRNVEDLDSFRPIKNAEGQLLTTPPREPQYSRVPGINPATGRENIAVGGAEPPVLDALATSLYTENRPTVVAKEVVQNARDEHLISGSKEPIKVVFNHGDINPVTGGPSDSITVRDYGRGLGPDDLYTKFTNIGESGKRAEEVAAGGFGFAKAAPLLSGKYANIESVVNEGGEKVKYSFEGNRKDLIDKRKGVGLYRQIVDKDTPTGMTVTTHFDKGDSGMYDAEQYLERMAENSHTIPDLHITDHYRNTGGRNASPSSQDSQLRRYLNNEVDPLGAQTNIYRMLRKVKSSGGPKPLQDTIDLPGNKINIHYEEPTRETDTYNLHLLNKGLYQKTLAYQYYDHPIVAPSNIVADIHTSIEEGEEGYPFGLNREQVSSEVSHAIRDWVKDNVESGALKKGAAEIQNMYDSMKPIIVKGLTSRETAIFDPGDKLTQHELKFFQTNPTVVDVTKHLDTVIDSILKSTGVAEWEQRLEKTGLSLPVSDTEYGIHIPNPKTGQSAIMIAWLNSIDKYINSPRQAAHDIIITAMHEVGHIGESYNRIPSLMDPVDLQDPDIGYFLLNYLNHVKEQGAGNPGHGQNFISNLAEVFATYGPRRYVDAANKLQSLISDQSGGYNAQIQKLLQLYQESRGRAAGTKDVLSPTGIKSADKGPTGAGAVPGNAKTTGNGPGPGFNISGEGITGEWKFTSPSGEKPSLEDIIKASSKQRHLYEMYNPKWKRTAQLSAISKTLRATLDMSIPLRQNFGFVGKPYFWRSIVPMIKASGEDFFEASQNSIFHDPDFPIASAAGVKFLGGPVKHDFFPKSAVEGWLGVRNSGRMATFASNKVRMDAWKAMTKGLSEGYLGQFNPRRNMVVAEEIAKFINTYSGSGHLGRWEKNVPFLNNFFFSVPLIKSRIDMVNDMINPITYWKDSKPIRIAKLKALFGMASFVLTATGLAAYAGADVGIDPTDSDFLKIKHGNARLDVLGGLGQNIVAAARMISWANKEMNGEKIDRFKSGKDIVQNFLENKLSPLPALINTLLKGKSFGKNYINIPQEIENIFQPMVTQDITDILQDDPSNLWMAPFGNFGSGIQVYGKDVEPTVEDKADEWIKGAIGR